MKWSKSLRALKNNCKNKNKLNFDPLDQQQKVLH